MRPKPLGPSWMRHWNRVRVRKRMCWPNSAAFHARILRLWKWESRRCLPVQHGLSECKSTDLLVILHNYSGYVLCNWLVYMSQHLHFERKLLLWKWVPNNISQLPFLSRSQSKSTRMYLRRSVWIRLAWFQMSNGQFNWNLPMSRGNTRCSWNTRRMGLYLPEGSCFWWHCSPLLRLSFARRRWFQDLVERSESCDGSIPSRVHSRILGHHRTGTRTTRRRCLHVAIGRRIHRRRIWLHPHESPREYLQLQTICATTRVNKRHRLDTGAIRALCLLEFGTWARK